MNVQDKPKIKKVHFLNGVLRKQTLILDSLENFTLYILKEKVKFYDKKQFFKVNPMIESKGLLHFIPHNYQKIISEIKGRKEGEYLDFLRLYLDL